MTSLRGFDRLEVGPVSLEPRALSAPYAVFHGSQKDEITLQYRYEQDVFDADDAADHNLGTMMMAQAALNYGLFCDQIVIHGPVDTVDLALLRGMLRNTNREILVHKLCQPNPFLLPGRIEINASDIPSLEGAPLLSPRLSNSRIVAPWEHDNHRVAVLSSGGKESLLTFGLMRELGFEVHPIYINESGRHWFTALNAHRGFKNTVPTTQRVWTNIDRVYNWMLRHLPFIRQDFAHVRADQYPIRLWTVAGLIVGSLPLLRARAIGRLLIGNEYDTSLRLSFHGLSHYGGLYDQSHWFDAALSKYYDKKRWGIKQFSILRPLSELLVQKTLAQRYPQLQAWQVSCHAAHLDEEKALPCGRCEKCRRVVGMLEAIGADPGRCGYTAAQIEQTMAALASQSLHQDAPTSEHLLWLLTQRGKLPQPSRRRARPHPEVMQLRFDTLHAPFDLIPLDLRQPLLRLMLEHADGALIRQHRTWAPFDPRE